MVKCDKCVYKKRQLKYCTGCLPGWKLFKRGQSGLTPIEELELIDAFEAVKKELAEVKASKKFLQKERDKFKNLWFKTIEYH